MCEDLHQDLIGEECGHDLLIVGSGSMLEHVKTKFNERVLVNSASITSWLDGHERPGDFLKRRISVDFCIWHVEPY